MELLSLLIFHVGDPLPSPSTFEIQNWKQISEKLNVYRQHSIKYLTTALANATKLTK